MSGVFLLSDNHTHLLPNSLTLTILNILTSRTSPVECRYFEGFNISAVDELVTVAGATQLRAYQVLVCGDQMNCVHYIHNMVTVLTITEADALISFICFTLAIYCGLINVATPGFELHSHC